MSSKREFSHHFLSGASSGLISAISLQPLDLLKTRVQQGGPTGISGILCTVRHIVAIDGVLGLWRGTMPTLLRNVPGVALYFYTLQTVRHTMTTIPYLAAAPPSVSSGSTLPRLSNPANLAAGAISRVAVGFVLNPITVVKARYESNIYAYRSMAEAIRSIIRKDAPYAGLFVMSYEFTKDTASVLFKPRSTSAQSITLSLSGACAAAIATILTHPFDVLKTNMQVHPTRYPTLIKAAILLGRERNLRGYFDGMALRLGKKVLSSAISWTVYENLLVILKS
ncbi:hypothetical protein BS47DRAFT_1338310 [Hydnum rufescens UP504]|uniref:Solute carrier family 25 member 38 homolog n=1 Tax=Hydnum rufescens UP504 TaxID=1448309 RepID=A0A9P6E0X6_9AGAM|nr:hypothetical protein BS47DRAFT_1338310 [Hydnum rufescens UP504]